MLARREIPGMRLTGRIAESSISFAKARLVLDINEIADFKICVDELGNRDKLSIEIKPYRNKRSLDANAYAWVLMDKLAAKIGRTKTEIYREYITHIGGVSEIVCIKTEAVDRMCEAWHRNGLGWQTETFPSKIEGCTNVILYYGSSSYDSAQMHRLLDMIIQDCTEQGIPTETPNEILKMISLWEGEKNV